MRHFTKEWCTGLYCRMVLLTHGWRCPVLKCDELYDRGELESTLMLIVNERQRLYYQQELVCTKCQSVAKSLLSEHCKNVENH